MTRSSSGSDDSNGSRKRHSDDHFETVCSSKKPNCGASAVHLKVLIPSIAAGAVIGKDGEAIERIQKESGANVKISKRNDFYPGTLERVCLIVGTFEAVASTHNFVMERIFEKGDIITQPIDGRVVPERHKQVKILVPNSTAGMIIGKNGTYIQEIKERSEAYVQVSQKSREFSLHERCVIVAGDLHQMRAAMDLILFVIAADPQSSSCPNLSYADVRGPVSSVYPTGSPYAFPFITANTVNPILRPDPPALTSLTAPNPYLVGLPVASINPMDAAVILQLTDNGDHLSSLRPQQQNAIFNAFLRMTGSIGDGLLSADDSVATGNHNYHTHPRYQQQQLQYQQQESSAASTQPMATTGFLGTLCSNPAFLSAAAVFNLITSPAVAAASAATGGLQTPMTPQYLGERGSAAFVGTSAFPPMATSAAAAQICPFGSLPPPTFAASPLPSSSAISEASMLQAVAALASLASASSRTTSTITSANSAASTTGALNIFDIERSNVGGCGTIQTEGAAAVGASGRWKECKDATELQNPTYLTTSNAALMGLYATAVANPNALITPTAGPNLLQPSAGGHGGLLCTREIFIPENLIDRISGPQGRQILNLQAQTNTFIQVFPKSVFVSGLQSRVISISGDQINVNYAAAMIENAIAMEQLNQRTCAMHAPIHAAYGDSVASYANQDLGKSNRVVTSDHSVIEGATDTSCPMPQQPPKQPAF